MPLLNDGMLKSIVDSLPRMVFWKSTDGCYLGANKAFLEFIGLPDLSQLIGKKDDELDSTIQKKEYLNKYDNLVIQTRQSHLSITDHFSQNGVLITLITDKHPLFDDNNLLIGVLGITSSESNNTSSIQAYLENIIASVPCYIFWKNINSIYLGCNQKFASLINKKPSDVIGKTDRDLGWNKNEIATFIEGDKDVLSGKPKINVEEVVRQPDGSEKIMLVSKAPVLDKNNQCIGILGISIDITERKRMEEELHSAKERAEAANQAKSNFIANMSHDIRTPLTGVIGLSEMLESELAEPEQKENAHLLHDSGEELLNMLNDILDDVRADHMNEDDLQEESFDLYECLDDLVKLELPTTKVKNLDLKLDIASDVPQFLISDRKKIQRILLNLVGNAIKFTQSGQITIEVTCLDNKKSRVHLQFGVADTGIGIPEELQVQVFDRFFRVTSSYKGLYQGHGLGLHIAQSYVSLLGGHITLTSEEGVGSTFYFDLSCKLGHKEATQKQDGLLLKPIKSVPELKPVTQALLSEDCPYLLLVEDNPTALKILENLCVKNQCRFVSAQNGEDARELAKSNSFDLIITDIGLPGISGIELTQAIREYEKSGSHPSVPIIGLTAHALAEAATPCIDAGMNKVFQKPMKPDMMELIIDVFLKSHNHQDKRPAPQQQANPGLGIDLPATEEELFLLNNFPVLDMEEGIKCLGSDTLLQELLIQMAQQDIPVDLQDIQNAFDAQDWKQVEKIAHKMKGGAVYCGTIRLKLACQYLERYYKAGHRNQLPALYSQLITVAQDTVDSIKLHYN